MSNSQKRRVGGRPDPVAQARRASSGSTRTTLWVVAAVVVIAVVVGVLIAVNRDGDDSAAAGGSSAPAMPANTVSGTSVLLGDQGKGAKVELWIDLQCPACKAYETRVSDTLSADVVAGTAHLVVHPVAILDQASTTKYSSRAGAASYCAADEGKFWPYIRVLYAKQPAEGSAGLTDAELASLGKSAGLTSETFATCVTSNAKADVIAKSTDQANADGLSATPTIEVDGKKLSQGTLEELVDAIAKANTT